MAVNGLWEVRSESGDPLLSKELRCTSSNIEGDGVTGANVEGDGVTGANVEGTV